MQKEFRPPAVPLITVDPFFSVWSFADTLNSDVTRHWTGTANSLLGLVRIDGQPWRFCGLETENRGELIGPIPAIPQTSLKVTATGTTYQFAADGLALTVHFRAPLLASDLDLASWPLNYLTISAQSLDGRPHLVELYLDLDGSLCSDRLEKARISGSTAPVAGLPAASLTNEADDSVPLGSSGDDQRINWGTVYIMGLDPAAQTFTATNQIRQAFVKTGRADLAELEKMVRLPGKKEPLVAGITANLTVEPDQIAETVFLLAYDDLGMSIDYFGSKKPAYCFRNGASFTDIIAQAACQYEDVQNRCCVFDEELAQASQAAGGPAYAALTPLAYRQSFASHKLIVDDNDQIIFLSKECFSNGCIGTVDVSYPSIPMYLIYNPELVRGMLRPVFRFAKSPDWPFDFAPHDVGQYPLATGQVYGKREGKLQLRYQMPVEECGNMLIMTAAVCYADNDYSIAEENIEQLAGWAAYLEEYGQDPGEQLCTDDFAGHLARNANLAVKAIVGLAAYGQILARCGRAEEADRVRDKAASMARTWQEMADTGDHTVLVFDKPETWSQKYNMLFDKLLGLGLFDQDLIERDFDYWLSKQNRYGLPLDIRDSYTKADWIIWCSALTGDPAKARALIDPLYRFYNETGSRVPLTDWYDTISGQVVHFRNRTVIGGLFALALKDHWSGHKSE